ncbi:hypothetical protein NDU88_004707 [Pleurodeles waltl]|uniref:Uncharacterized protein n=1 Tax=Pleurodeles waltl TaxID=8319 RepID=A0AAV7WWR9_PLEWA|nr:hypothetical protein NDU88_004707 [Pleurodeles waltl]
MKCQACVTPLATSDILLSGRVWSPQAPALVGRPQARHGAQAPRARSDVDRALPFSKGSLGPSRQAAPLPEGRRQRRPSTVGGARHSAGPGAAASTLLQGRSAASGLLGTDPPSATGDPGAVPQGSAASQQSSGGAGPRRQTAPSPAEAAGVGPAARQLSNREEGSNSVRSEAAAAGRAPGQLGGRHLTREE